MVTELLLTYIKELEKQLLNMGQPLPEKRKEINFDKVYEDIEITKNVKAIFNIKTDHF